MNPTDKALLRIAKRALRRNKKHAAQQTTVSTPYARSLVMLGRYAAHLRDMARDDETLALAAITARNALRLAIDPENTMRLYEAEDRADELMNRGGS